MSKLPFYFGKQTKYFHYTSYLLKTLKHIILLILTFAFWFPSPIRDQWLWLIFLLLPIYAVHYCLHGRFWTMTPFDELFAVFIALCVINIFTAPYATRGILLIFRPLLGIALVWWFVESTRQNRRMNHLFHLTIIFALFVGVLGIVAVDWSGRFDFLEEFSRTFLNLPQSLIFEGGFNPNEIAGAMCYLAPVCWGLALRGRLGRWWIVTTLLAAVILTAAIVVGGSRSAWIGMIVALPVVMVRRHWWPWLAGAAVTFIAVVQLLIMIAPGVPLHVLQTIVPDQRFRTVQHRVELWESSLAILQDHPLTGAGMAMFRNPMVRTDYPVPNFPTGNWHSHNEILAIGTDLGLPGIVVFVGFYVIAAAVLRYCWIHGDDRAAAAAMALSGGLIAHAVYGLADAIPPWDRFAFIFWSLLGLCAAQYYLVKTTREKSQIEDQRSVSPEVSSI
jgi:hypothetical protein